MFKKKKRWERCVCFGAAGDKPVETEDTERKETSAIQILMTLQKMTAGLLHVSGRFDPTYSQYLTRFNRGKGRHFLPDGFPFLCKTESRFLKEKDQALLFKKILCGTQCSILNIRNIQKILEEKTKLKFYTKSMLKTATNKTAN